MSECNSPYGYVMEALVCCPECGHEWSINTSPEEENVQGFVKDANGNRLENGDDVIDLPVKGAPKPIKADTKVKNIRLTYGNYNIDCKISGFGAMALKS